MTVPESVKVCPEGVGELGVLPPPPQDTMESESKRNTIAIRTPAAATEGDCFMILLLLHAPG